MFKIYNNSLDFSGNKSTLDRLSKILKIESTNDIQDNVIGIHAYKFGKEIINKNKNFILIIGGTDINIDINDQNKKKIVTKCIEEAKYVVTFNKNLKKKVLNLTNINEEKVKIIPQSIGKVKRIEFNLKEEIKKKYNLEKINKIFIMVGNLRSVKDPLFLKNEFKKLFDNENTILVIIGNIIEGEYQFNNGIYHLNGLEKEQIYYCMKHCDGLINTSISEGMSMSILEAMKNKCPVYARDNEGNRSIINDNSNGFLFSKASDFLEVIKKDTKDIIKNAFDYVNAQHNSITEKYKYTSLF